MDMTSIAPSSKTSTFISEHITPREIQILALMAQGFVNKQIGERLNISTETVKKHIKNVYKKTNSHNKIEALNKIKWLTASLLPDRN